ncbi:MAG: CHAP domain-containing protein [Lachnospiraceae bacterium]|nr:CHAP domain-containing protein [Lachnospiraceae bacterium]
MKFLRRVLPAVLLAAACILPAAGVQAAKSSLPVLSKLESVDRLTRGSEFFLKGKIKSADPLTKVRIKIIDQSGKTVQSASAVPTGKSFSLKKCSGQLHFENLGKGSYTLRITASDEKHRNVKLLKQRFSVVKKKKIAEKLIRTAEAEIGYETPLKLEKTKYEKETFGTNGNLWCASFVSWCSNQAGVSKKTVPRSKSTLYMGTLAKKHYHRWNRNSWGNLKRGDVVFFSPKRASLRFPNGGKAVHHVGIVQRVDRKRGVLHTVEGNVSKLLEDGSLDIWTRVVRECTHKLKTGTGLITESDNYHFADEYVCGYIDVR